MTTFRTEATRRSHGRGLVVALLAGGMFLVGGVPPTEAALTTPACLAKKLKEWGKLRNCQAKENAKALQAKPADPAKCQVKFDAKFAALNAQATAAAIACRYGVNGDGTATDYDTGLVWERKTDDGSVHDRDNQYTWNTAFGGTAPNGTAFTVFLGTLNNGASGDGVATSGCFAGHCDWRLPAIEELAGIVDLTIPGCGSGHACIDISVFGSTLALSTYWSATTYSPTPSATVWYVFFHNGLVSNISKANSGYARAVRSGL